MLEHLRKFNVLQFALIEGKEKQIYCVFKLSLDCCFALEKENVFVFSLRVFMTICVPKSHTKKKGVMEVNHDNRSIAEIKKKPGHNGGHNPAAKKALP